MWVPVRLTSKISDDWIKDLEFNPYLKKILLVSWSTDKEFSFLI